MSRSSHAVEVAARRPTEKLIAEDEPGLAALEHERPVGKLVERGGVENALS
jgi:hypothetical protein